MGAGAGAEVGFKSGSNSRYSADKLSLYCTKLNEKSDFEKDIFFTVKEWMSALPGRQSTTIHYFI